MENQKDYSGVRSAGIYLLLLTMAIGFVILIGSV